MNVILVTSSKTLFKPIDLLIVRREVKDQGFFPVYEWILDLFDGAEAVGGGGGPVRNNSSM